MRPPIVAEMSQNVMLFKAVELTEVITHESVSATPVRLVMLLHGHENAVVTKAIEVRIIEDRIVDYWVAGRFLDSYSMPAMSLCYDGTKVGERWG